MCIAVIGAGNVEGALPLVERGPGARSHASARQAATGDASADDAVLTDVPSNIIADALGNVRGLDGKVGVVVTNTFAGRNGAYPSLARM